MLNGVYKVLVFIKRRKAISALKSKKKVRMLSSLANYLLGGNISGAQGSRQRSNNETPETHPVMARLSQVEIEGDDWILIDRTDNPASSTTFFDSILVDGTTALEESWYVTPPACFTRAGPVNVETSPLEDLLIEHPSMSVYRATAPSIAPETPPPTPDAPEERVVEEDALPNVASSAPVTATPASPERAPGRSQNGQQATRRQDTRDERPRARTEKRIVQLRSAQKHITKINFNKIFECQWKLRAGLREEDYPSTEERSPGEK
ncbi:tumor protein p53 inducible nuclear protein isoform X4 [Bombus vancouverensis nearcticus]|uniref:tumor protein p53 inducible nuclear protein isoform X4 n=1 Tax=Bombus vancouverensis nearcticus TaxID=2705178 RepID=UPI00402BEAC2